MTVGGTRVGPADACGLGEQAPCCAPSSSLPAPVPVGKGFAACWGFHPRADPDEKPNPKVLFQMVSRPVSCTILGRHKAS